MRNYFESLILTDGNTRAVSAFTVCCPDIPTIPRVGTYNKGLISVVDLEIGKQIGRICSQVIGDGCIALCYTAFGDFHYWSPQTDIGFLDVQGVDSVPDVGDYEWLVDRVFYNDGIQRDLLKTERVKGLVEKLGPLKYGQVYILEPWVSLGGLDTIDNYGVGSFTTYLELVSQTLF